MRRFFVFLCLFSGMAACGGTPEAPPKAEPVFTSKMDMKWITKGGKMVELLPVPGKVTVFDFAADWCGPCKDVDRLMIKVLAQHTDVALRKIDVDDWDSPISKKYLETPPSIPYMVIMDAKGERVGAISGFEPEQIRAMLKIARQRSAGTSRK